MPSIIVLSSQLAREQRWDPKFYLAKARAESPYQGPPRASSLLTDDEARMVLAQFSPEEKTPCLVLARGGTLRSESLVAVEREYPHLALALLEQTLPVRAQTLREYIQRAQQHLDQLTSMLPVEPPRPAL